MRLDAKKLLVLHRYVCVQSFWRIGAKSPKKPCASQANDHRWSHKYQNIYGILFPHSPLKIYTYPPQQEPIFTYSSPTFLPLFCPLYFSFNPFLLFCFPIVPPNTIGRLPPLRVLPSTNADRYVHISFPVVQLVGGLSCLELWLLNFSISGCTSLFLTNLITPSFFSH